MNYVHSSSNLKFVGQQGAVIECLWALDARSDRFRRLVGGVIGERNAPSMIQLSFCVGRVRLTRWIEKVKAMKSLCQNVKEFLDCEDGPTAVEYAVMLALIIVVCITAVTNIGTKANAKFQSAASKL